MYIVNKRMSTNVVIAIFSVIAVIIMAIAIAGLVVATGNSNSTATGIGPEGPAGPAGSGAAGSAGSNWSTVLTWNPVTELILSVTEAFFSFPTLQSTGGPIIPVENTFKGHQEVSPYTVALGTNTASTPSFTIQFATQGLYRLSMGVTMRAGNNISTNSYFMKLVDTVEPAVGGVTFTEMIGMPIYFGYTSSNVVDTTNLSLSKLYTLSIVSGGSGGTYTDTMGLLGGTSFTIEYLGLAGDNS